MSKQQAALEPGDKALFSAPSTLRNCLLNWLVPGMGYWLTGRKQAGMIVSGLLFAAILMGVIQGGDLYPLGTSEGKLRAVGTLCQMGMGLPWLIFKFLLERGTPLSPTYDYGTNYFLIAGMLNWLGVIDIFDISVKRK